LKTNTMEDINVKHDPLNADGEVECRWCDAHLTWANEAGPGICSHCNNLMVAAGLDHAEIFGIVG
jgi:hypothetical protein